MLVTKKDYKMGIDVSKITVVFKNAASSVAENGKQIHKSLGGFGETVSNFAKNKLNGDTFQTIGNKVKGIKLPDVRGLLANAIIKIKDFSFKNAFSNILEFARHIIKK